MVRVSDVILYCRSTAGVRVWLRTPLRDERPCTFVIPLRLLHTTLVGCVLCAETIRKGSLTILSGCFPEIPKFMSEVLDLAHLAD